MNNVMKKTIASIIFVISISALSADIEVTIEKPKTIIRISDISQRDPNPPDGVAYVPDKGILLFPNPTKEAKEWYDKYSFPLSLIVNIKNISDKELFLFQEWNSWGYYNLKFVFYDGFHEYWVTKKEGLWYRNFPSWNILKPGEFFNIPVALTTQIWNGIETTKDNSKKIVSIRALYEQHITGKIGVFGRDDEWQGSVSSKYYSASAVLPDFRFKNISQPNIDKADGLEIK
jgi:hypothetical protein